MATARVLAAGVLHECNTHSASFLLRQSSFILPIKHQNVNFSRRASSKRAFTCKSLYKPEIQIKQEGQPETLDYRVFLQDNSGKRTSAKMEVATDEVYAPIKQDTKKGKLRFYPYNVNWNCGLLPQTWEEPTVANSEVDGEVGDNDPVDVVEIGDRQGQARTGKPLGAFVMIDEGELDWKIIAISLDDPRASLVNDVGDVEKHFPGTLTAIRDWFRDYKIPDVKSCNKFGLGNKAADKDYALNVRTETNEAWAKLVKRSVPAGELSLL